MSAVAADLEANRARPATASRPRSARARDALPRGLGVPVPWQRRDAVVTLVLGLIGAAIVGICWNGASREAAFRDQVGWTVGAFAGSGIFALGGGYWLLVGFRRTRQAMTQLRADSELVFGIAVPVADALGPRTEPAATFVIAPGMHLVHQPGCLLARGKDVRILPAAEAGTYARCSMCAR